MSDKPKRRFWQIHLSTAVVMMVLAGIFVCLNLKRRFEVTESRAGHHGREESGLIEHGWPVTAFHHYALVLNYKFASNGDPMYRAALEREGTKALNEQGKDAFYLEEHGIVCGLPDQANVAIIGLIVDVLVFVSALVTTAYLLESFFRRREARKP